jgi:hypothetical protein
MATGQRRITQTLQMKSPIERGDDRWGGILEEIEESDLV